MIRAAILAGLVGLALGGFLAWITAEKLDEQRRFDDACEAAGRASMAVNGNRVCVVVRPLP